MRRVLMTMMWLAMAAVALPVHAAPLFSGSDTMDYDVIGVRPYAIQGTKALVMLIQSHSPQTGDYVVTMRSMAEATNKQLIAEVRFRAGEEEKEPYASWLDSCFVKDGTFCNQNPGQRMALTLSKLLEKIETIIRQHPSA